MARAKQNRRLARSMGLTPTYGVRLARRPRKGAELRRVGDGDVTLCGDIMYSRSRLSEAERKRGCRAARRLCGDCSNSSRRFGCGDVLESHACKIPMCACRDDNGINDDLDDQPSVQFGSHIEEIRVMRS